MVSNWKPAVTLQSFIVGRMALKITTFYVMYCLPIWNQGLEFAKQVWPPAGSDTKCALHSWQRDSLCI